MELHQNARIIYYIDEVLTDAPTQLPILIGELGKGELRDNLPMDIYSNEGIRVGSMIVEHQEEREEKRFEETIRRSKRGFFHVAFGRSTVIILLLFLGSLIMLSLGIIGYYLGNIYEEIKDRPRYIVADTCGKETKK